MEHVLERLTKVDLLVDNARKYMSSSYIGHICQDCAKEANQSVKIICSCKTNWKCEKHSESLTELPNNTDREYIIAKCAFRT
jgi:hypothetical protein